MLCGGALLAAPTLAASAADTDPTKIKKLRGVVGPGFDISINDERVRAGTYRLIVRDRSGIHNFHIFGAGVDEETAVGGTGTSRWRITLQPGAYVIQCEPHSGTMNVDLVVT